MCEQTEINYLDGEVAWVKLGSCWWPGEVVALEKLPPDVLRSFRKPPIACVKFFQEDTYEYVKNINNIYKYNCSRKHEFINKGLYMFRTKHGHMEKFPQDVIRAEAAIGGDEQILTREEFRETKKESYAGLFGDPKKTPNSIKKGKSGRGRPPAESPNGSTPHRQMKEKTDYKVHILVQGSKSVSTSETLTSEVTSTASTSGSDLTSKEKPQDENTSQIEGNQQNEDNSENRGTPNSSISIPPTPLRSAPPSSAPSSSGIYACHACPFTTTRLNVLILHTKTHSISFIPYTPSPVRKKPTAKSPVKLTPNSSKTPKPRKQRKEKTDKKPPKKLQGKKRPSEEKPASIEVKKPKTDEEIKSSLLADWDDDVDEDSNDESAAMISGSSPSVPVGAESPAVPTPAELPSAQAPSEMSPVPDKKSSSSPSAEKPESSSDSKYEFCEDEDWPEEADFGRKIPRVKNPVRTEDIKSIGIDEDEVAREVAELLNKTAVPELPSVPEPLKIEENFPEPSIVKSPDKNKDKALEKSGDKGVNEAPLTKAIFKTKTFFRSRHSRSQDAIGKYVAEQLNAVERMDISDIEINGSEAVSSPEARDSPPIEPVKVARLAPKIQLKKMKAEAAQLREKEKMSIEPVSETSTFSQLSNVTHESTKPIETFEAMNAFVVKEEHANNKNETSLYLKQDVLYPTQEIKPVNAENRHIFNTEVVLEQFTDKDAFMAEVTEFGKEIPNIEAETPTYEEQVVHTSQQEKTPNQEENLTLQDESPIHGEEKQTLEEENLTLEEDKPKRKEVKPILEKETSKLQQATRDFKIETTIFEEETSEFQERPSEVDSETSQYEREGEKAPKFENSSDIDKETSKYDEQVQITRIEEETSEKGSPFIEEETQRSENKMTTLEERDEPSQFSEEDGIHQDLHINKKSELKESHVPSIKLPEPSDEEIPNVGNETLTKELTNDKSQHQIGPYMNESTASAVDALLSVSREADRVPRAVTNDLPEDLFEDDKDVDIPEPNDENKNFNEKADNRTDILAGNGLEEHSKTEEVHHVESIPEGSKQEENILLETSTPEIPHSEEIVVDTVMDPSEPLQQEESNVETILENVPSESDLQVAEALINLPSTTIPTKTPTEHKQSIILPFSFDHENSQEEIVPASEDVFINETEIEFQEKDIVTETVEPVTESIPTSDSDNLNSRFETEQEKSENLNAAQSLVQMSESIEHKINVAEQMDTTEITEPNAFIVKQNNGLESSLNSVEHNVALLSSDNKSEIVKPKSIIKIDQSSSKLLKILEEPCKPRITVTKTTPIKQIIQGKEKILNFDVAKSPLKSKTPKQKIIIRRTAPAKTVLNNVKELPGSDKIFLSRSGNQAKEGSSVQTYTIQTSPDAPSDANTIIIQQKLRKITKPAIIQPKLQKIKPHTSMVAPINEIKTNNKPQTTDDAMFDINSMPIVLSEDLLTPESIEKMPVVMSDGNIVSQSQSTTKVIKPKQNAIELEKVAISSAPHKSEGKTLLLNPGVEVTKSATPNILSKSSKLRGAKPMLVIDKTTGKQKIIMTKAEPAVKEVKQAPPMVQPAVQAPKTEKFIILPTQNASPRPARTQKIVIDPQTGKAHVYVAKGSDAPLSATENKPVSAKLVPSSADTSNSGNTVMIITNAQGAQSRIVLTPEHEKILFPNKQQPNVSQLKTIAHRLTAPAPAQKTLLTTIAPVRTPAIAPAKAPPRIVPKQKSAIITSKGQLIVGGRVATTAQNIAPMPELRPVQRRIITSEPKKLTQAVQKSNSEPIIFLQQKSGAVMQLTAAQFEHLQRTGQIVQKAPAPAQEKIVIQKVKATSEPGPSVKSRARKTTTISPMPSKKAKHEIAIAPAPLTFTAAQIPAASGQPPAAASSAYSEFENFEEMLPSTAIARQPEPPPQPAPQPSPQPAPQPQAETTPAPAPAPSPAAISDQLLAVPGEHFGALPGTFYLCVEEGGMFTPIDNRPLVLENNQLVPMPEPAPAPPERRDILEAALANSDVFHAEPPDEAPDFRDLNANVSVHCRVSETSSTLHQPIMTPVELPASQAAVRAAPSLEAGLAVIGVTPPSVPTSLELPITVTDPRIAPRAADPLSGAPISMPLLTEDEAVGKSMPILTEESAGSPDEAWARRLLAPGSDSDGSGEIPLQPALQLLQPRS